MRIAIPHSHFSFGMVSIHERTSKRKVKEWADCVELQRNASHSPPLPCSVPPVPTLWPTNPVMNGQKRFA